MTGLSKLRVPCLYVRIEILTLKGNALPVLIINCQFLGAIIVTGLVTQRVEKSQEPFG